MVEWMFRSLYSEWWFNVTLGLCWHYLGEGYIGLLSVRKTVHLKLARVTALILKVHSCCFFCFIIIYWSCTWKRVGSRIYSHFILQSSNIEYNFAYVLHLCSLLTFKYSKAQSIPLSKSVIIYFWYMYYLTLWWAGCT